MIAMRRRDVIALLSAAAAAWPLTARAQQPALPVIGFLVTGSSSSHGQWLAAAVKRLRELGWIEGRNVAFEYRFAEGREQRFAELAAELVQLKVAVIVTSGGALLPAKQATSVIPIVFAVAGDPVGIGAVASLARPGGNVTGLSLQQTDLAGKRLELLREVIPGLRRLAIMANVTASSAVLDLAAAEAAARALGLSITRIELARAEEIAPAFAALAGRVDGLYVCGDPIVVANRSNLNRLVLAARLPTISDLREFSEAGGLISYGANFLDLYRRAADFVDKILRGTKPADIPVEQPTKFDFVINLKTAKALGLEVPPTLLTRADEVIE